MSDATAFIVYEQQPNGKDGNSGYNKLR